MSNEADERIKAAAAELAAALTEAGGEYEVRVHATDVTTFNTTSGKRWFYDVHVVERRDRTVAP